mmetsp:Transcript_35341/g.83172  ORF Transcript_35341/g.83172 Transcript_35341/m.83172 type:complete len:218 (-) Transcript_35341:14-667(-)
MFLPAAARRKRARCERKMDFFRLGIKAALPYLRTKSISMPLRTLDRSEKSTRLMPLRSWMRRMAKTLLNALAGLGAGSEWQRGVMLSYEWMRKASMICSSSRASCSRLPTAGRQMLMCISAQKPSHLRHADRSPAAVPAGTARSIKPRARAASASIEAFAAGGRKGGGVGGEWSWVGAAGPPPSQSPNPLPSPPSRSPPNPPPSPPLILPPSPPPPL